MPQVHAGDLAAQVFGQDVGRHAGDPGAQRALLLGGKVLVADAGDDGGDHSGQASKPVLGAPDHENAGPLRGF